MQRIAEVMKMRECIVLRVSGQNSQRGLRTMMLTGVRRALRKLLALSLENLIERKNMFSSTRLVTLSPELKVSTYAALSLKL